jgi:hypothetical protein
MERSAIHLSVSTAAVESERGGILLPDRSKMLVSARLLLFDIIMREALGGVTGARFIISDRGIKQQGQAPSGTAPFPLA